MNLASRLEGENKAWGTRVLLSRSTRDGSERPGDLEPIGQIHVRGKAGPVEIHTVAGTRAH